MGADFLLSLLENVERPDFLIFAGDGILGFLSGEYLERFPENVKTYVERFIENGGSKINRIVDYPKITFLYVEGNDDPEIDISFLGAVRLSGRIFKCKLNFLGLEGSSDPIGGITHRTEEYYREILSRAIKTGESYILISHAPPYGILDRIPRGIRVGSRVLREFLESHSKNFPLVISGHAHNWGGRWRRFGESVVINCAMSLLEIKLKGEEVQDIRLIF